MSEQRSTCCPYSSRHERCTRFLDRVLGVNLLGSAQDLTPPARRQARGLKVYYFGFIPAILGELGAFLWAVWAQKQYTIGSYGVWQYKLQAGSRTTWYTTKLFPNFGVDVFETGSQNIKPEPWQMAFAGATVLVYLVNAFLLGLVVWAWSQRCASVRRAPQGNDENRPVKATQTLWVQERYLARWVILAYWLALIYGLIYGGAVWAASSIIQGKAKNSNVSVSMEKGFKLYLILSIALYAVIGVVALCVRLSACCHRDGETSSV